MAEIPMPVPTAATQPLSFYKLLSFDVFGSLVEYKQHILKSFKPLIARLPADSAYHDATPLSATITNCATKGDVEFLKLFQKTEDAIKLELADKPMRFDAVLQEIYRRIARALQVESSDDEAQKFGSVETIQSWPLFDGTVESLQRLSDLGYRLVALSNIDSFATEISFQATGLCDVPWSKVFTAEDFGTSAEDLKLADQRKLEKLLEHCVSAGVKKEETLHIAQSLGHDHKPAKDMVINSVFLIGDGPVWGKESESKMAVEKGLVGYGWRCKNLQEFVDIAIKDR